MTLHHKPNKQFMDMVSLLWITMLNSQRKTTFVYRR